MHVYAHEDRVVFVFGYVMSFLPLPLAEMVRHAEADTVESVLVIFPEYFRVVKVVGEYLPVLTLVDRLLDLDEPVTTVAGSQRHRGS